MLASDVEKLTDFKRELNPDVWENGNMRLDVAVHLLQIAKAFVKFINISELRLHDITVSGSNASYNYNDHSDIDLHLVVDMQTPCGAELKELFNAKKSLFNDQHDIMIYGHPVEVYVQDKNEPHISNGIYSLLRSTWIKKPKTISASPDKTNILDKAKFLTHEINRAVESGDHDAINKVQARIKDMRTAGLAANGEFGVENMAFKLLRNTGELGRLWGASTKAQDEKLSIR